MVTKRSHLLKQTCRFQPQFCSSMCDLFVTTRHQKAKSKIFQIAARFKTTRKVSNKIKKRNEHNSMPKVFQNNDLFHIHILIFQFHMIWISVIFLVTLYLYFTVIYPLIFLFDFLTCLEKVHGSKEFNLLMNHESRPVKSNPESYRNLGLKIGRTKVINILKLNLSTFKILKHHHKKMRAEHHLSVTMLKNVKNKYQWHFYALFVQCKPGSHMLSDKKHLYPLLSWLKSGKKETIENGKTRKNKRVLSSFTQKRKVVLKISLQVSPNSH